jgi:hypothetical protein
MYVFFHRYSKASSRIAAQHALDGLEYLKTFISRLRDSIMHKHWPEWKQELAALGLKPTIGNNSSLHVASKEDASKEDANAQEIDHQEQEHQLHTWVKQLVYRWSSSYCPLTNIAPL